MTRSHICPHCGEGFNPGELAAIVVRSTDTPGMDAIGGRFHVPCLAEAQLPELVAGLSEIPGVVAEVATAVVVETLRELAADLFNTGRRKLTSSSEPRPRRRRDR